ncbi:MAG: bifunctional enoyl-CoA hydratase/phosphate acetyltransferase [candidate division Zixibacteria bacterium]|nr:bifunctional enoyl-CoA hydratase/phosphate acetyltransferase [candidate division Zixibacteria bacterium]
MKSLNDILDLAKKIGPKKVAVALAEDEEILLALEQARKEKIIQGILVGTKEKIEKLAIKNKIDIQKFEIEEETDGFVASLKCSELINRGEADLMMKGLVRTAHFMKAILDKEKGLGTGKLLSHVAVFEIPRYPKLLMITDAAINISPSLMEKAQIIQNAVDVLHFLGIETPLVACIAAVEKVNPEKMPATVDCACLSKMAQRGQIKGAVVDGPLGLDNAISEKSAEIKGIKSQVAGNADIILCPNIETGNAIYKTLIEFAFAKCAAIVAGTKVPVILTSRADSHETKFMSIALGVASCKG